MPLNNPRPGINYAVEYQGSSLPWVTSSTATTTASVYRFDNVSRFLVLLNHAAVGSGTDVYLGFTQNGINGTNYIRFQPQNSPQNLELRVKEVWIKSSSGTPSFSLLAGLTNISATSMGELSGTLSDGSAGWNGVG